MPDRRFTDRSRIETHQRCPRSRYLGYQEGGRGITPLKTPLPLAVGGAVHKGFEVLLSVVMAGLPPDEDAAVVAALTELGLRRGAGLELDISELAAQGTSGQLLTLSLADQLAKMATDLGLPIDDPTLDQLTSSRRSGAEQFEEYLWLEQCALVEGMVRAWARRRMPALLEEFEVLEVEREGMWELASWKPGWPMAPQDEHDISLMFMSRPDALLLSRRDHSLYILSFKTAAQWDVRKGRAAEHDLQGLTEGIEVERRLGEWWDQVHGAFTNSHREAATACQDFCDANISIPMREYLAELPTPPRILGIHYEYLLKGSRWKDKDLSAKVGFDAYSQRSHLVRCYVNKKDPAQVNWSWDFLKDDGSASNLAWQTWKSQPIWERMTVKEWIGMLDQHVMTMSAFDSTTGLEPRELGYGGPAQATGTTAQHPLDAIFLPPITVYRNDDDLRDMIEQIEAQERKVVEALVRIEAASDEDERRSLLNQNFPQSRGACEYPSTCGFVKVCYGGEDIRRAPLESGLYKVREANHPQELGERR